MCAMPLNVHKSCFLIGDKELVVIIITKIKLLVSTREPRHTLCNSTRQPRTLKCIQAQLFCMDIYREYFQSI